MKLQELAAISPTKQAAKVFESYFGGTVSFEQLNRKQARHMLNRVRSLIAEHRQTRDFHHSEKNPTYLKLVVMEQGLASKLREVATVAAPGAPAVGGAPAAPGATPNPANMAMDMAKNKKAKQDQIKQLDDQIKALTLQKTQAQQALNNPAMGMAESHVSRLYRQLHESEVQQAQVVLASQDMVDQVQKMIEQVTSMQFKDLPALVDQVKNQIGQDQADDSSHNRC